MAPKVKPEESREKVRESLKKMGKDPDKLMPKAPATPESTSAGAAPSAGKKAAEDKATEKEQKETEKRALEAKQAEEAKKAEEEKQLLEAKDEDLSAEQKAKKKELLALKETEREAAKEAKLQKRFDELTGEIKALKAEKNQDKEQISKLENELQQLKSNVERNPEKNRQEVERLESERLKKYLAEDEKLPREKRREMSDEDLEAWLVEDIVGAQRWLARQELRRERERADDVERLNKGASDEDARTKAEKVIKRQAESSARVLAKHPELDVKKKVAELKAQGKTDAEIKKIIWDENPKVRISVEIAKEDPDKYMLAENGPELLAAEMERRLAAGKPGKPAAGAETEEEREARIAEEAAEAERQRQADIDAGLSSTRGAVRNSEQEKDPFRKKQFDVFAATWKRHHPNATDAEIKARFDKRMKQSA